MSYSSVLGNISTTAGGAKRAADIVAALAPPAPSSSALVKNEAPNESAKSLAFKWAPGIAAAGVGALMWKRHRFLGAVVGHAVASTALPIYRGGAERKQALCQLGVEGAAVAGSLMLPKHPIVGFVAGSLAGAAVTAFIPGSPTNQLWHKLTSK